jgi:[acyl-carrier-protein] S-malonyltransferase
MRMTSEPLGFLFPGQGSQSLGMLADLAEDFAQVRQIFAQASGVLGYDLWTLAQHGPEAELNRTEHTQPVMLTAGVAAWRVWRASGGAPPAAMAGPSLGEYTALVCAGSLPFEQAVTLVAERARLMREAVPQGQGAMAAILGLDDARVAELCRRVPGAAVVELANLNAPRQVVVAGETVAVEHVIALARDAGAKRSVRLAVSVPSHCSLMKPAAERFEERLQQVDFGRPEFPVIHNVDALTHQSASAIREALAAQMYRPVRWVEVLRRMQAEGIAALVECGPGTVLGGLAKRTVPALTVHSVRDRATLREALAATVAA